MSDLTSHCVITASHSLNALPCLTDRSTESYWQAQPEQNEGGFGERPDAQAIWIQFDFAVRYVTIVATTNR